jgi:malonyl-CoA/methylmalonyl-CoA synthetase
VPNQDSNLFSHFQRQFRAHADKELLCTEKNDAYTYADADSASARMAVSLCDAGVEPGDRISAQVQKTPDALCLYLACLRAGFVYHPLNPVFQAEELPFFLKDAQPKVIVCDAANESKIRSLAEKTTVRTLSSLDRDNGGTEDFDPVQRKTDDLAALLYSSGTTGVPKGIMLTHGNLLSNAEVLVGAWEFSENDRLLHALPVYHVHGLFVAINCVLLSGASMRWLPRFDAAQVIGFLPECTVMMGVPTYYTRMMQQESFSADACTHMRVFISGSAPLPEETFREFETRSGHRILERYGMTETGMNTSNPLHGARKAGTVGLPLPGIELRIADDIGELQVRGPNVFEGYWNLPNKTAEDLTDDGFFRTGDLGRIDDDGYVSIVGRAKDLVISGGINVYPREVELFLDGLPGVKESAVIGVPHADFGEAVIAIVVAKDDAVLSENELIEASRQGLANYKVPKRVVFVEELPRNAMAKIEKGRLRERFRGIFSQQSVGLRRS